MRIPDAVISQVADRTDMLEVVGRYAKLEKKGGRYWALCPFHQEKTASFSVSPDKQLYYCFGCQAKGTLFTFLMEMERISFVEAVRILAEQAGVEIELDEREQAEARRRDAMTGLLERVAGSYSYILANRPAAQEARAYLDSRGVQVEQRERYALGYAPTDPRWLHGFLSQRSYSPEFLAASGLFSNPRPGSQPYSFFRDRIMFPIRNPRGHTIGFGGRTIGPAEPKYLNSRESDHFRKGETLYGLYEASREVRRVDRVLLVEGYMDVVALSGAGILNAVAPLGTAFTPKQALLAKRYASRIVICFDGDEAGRRAAVKALAACEEAGLEATVVPLPQGVDPADLVQQGRVEELRRSVEEGVDGHRFLINYAAAEHDAATPVGKQRIVQFLAPVLHKIDSPVRRDGFENLIADTLMVDVHSVREELGRTATRHSTPTSRRAEAEGLSAELRLMLAVASRREHFTEIRTELTLDGLVEEAARSVYVACEESFRRGEESMDAFLAHIDDEATRDLVLSRLASGEFEDHWEDAVRDGIRRIKATRLDERRRRVSSQLKSLSQGSHSPHEMKELLEEKMHLDQELQQLKVTHHA